MSIAKLTSEVPGRKRLTSKDYDDLVLDVRSVNSINNKVYYIKDYIGEDNDAAAALRGLIANNRTVVFSPGNYYFKSQVSPIVPVVYQNSPCALIYNTDNFHIVATGAKIFIDDSISKENPAHLNCASSFIGIQKSTNCSIIGGEFVGNRTGLVDPAKMNNGLWLSSTINCDLTNVTFSGDYSNGSAITGVYLFDSTFKNIVGNNIAIGFDMAWCQDFAIDGFSFNSENIVSADCVKIFTDIPTQNNNETGLTLEGGISNNISISNGSVKNYDSSIFLDGVYSVNIDKCKIFDGQKNLIGPGYGGIVIVTSANTNSVNTSITKKIRIRNCDIYNCGNRSVSNGAGIVFHTGGYGIEDVIIESNDILDNYDFGIAALSDTGLKNLVIRNNNFFTGKKTNNQVFVSDNILPFMESLSVKDFGAVGDGVVDDTVAIQKYINFQSSRSFFINIIFPSGKFRTTSSLIIPSGFNSSVYGAGQEDTIILCDHNSTGILFGSVGSSVGVGKTRIEDLTITTTSKNANYAINIRCADPSNAASFNPSVQIQRVQTRGHNNVTSEWWAGGIYILNPATSFIKDNIIFGISLASPTVLESSTTAGIHIESSKLAVVHDLHNNTVLDYSYGIRLRNTGTLGLEGVNISVCSVVNCVYGYYAESLNINYGPPQLNIDRCHAEFYKYGIVINRFREINITNNLLYAYNYPGDIGASAVFLADVMTGNISNNQTHSNSNNLSLLGIEVFNNCSFLSIDNNTNNTPGFGVVLNSTSTNCSATNNKQRHVNNKNVQNNSTVSNFTPPASILYGSNALILDSSGYGTINMTVSNPALSPLYIISNGDSNNQAAAVFSIDKNNSTYAKLVFRVLPNPGAIPVRVNWISVA